MGLNIDSVQRPVDSVKFGCVWCWYQSQDALTPCSAAITTTWVSKMQVKIFLPDSDWWSTVTLWNWGLCWTFLALSVTHCDHPSQHASRHKFSLVGNLGAGFHTWFTEWKLLSYNLRINEGVNTVARLVKSVYWSCIFKFFCEVENYVTADLKSEAQRQRLKNFGQAIVADVFSPPSEKSEQKFSFFFGRSE